MYVSLPIVLRELRVLRTVRLTPRMVRLTVGGPQLRPFSDGTYDLAAFCTQSPDDHVKLVLPDPRTGALTLPTQDDGHLDWPHEPRPIHRDYTVRRYDADAGEVDIDVVLHDGTAGRWAATARPGDTIHLAGPRGSHLPDTGADWWVLAADETGLPAVARFIEEYAGPQPIAAFVLVDGPEEEQPDLPHVTWVHRPGGESGSTDASLLAGAVRDWTPPSGRGWGWTGAEAGIVREVRRVLKSDLGLSKDQIQASGYWRRGDTLETAEGAAEQAPRARRPPPSGRRPTVRNPYRTGETMSFALRTSALLGAAALLATAGCGSDTSDAAQDDSGDTHVVSTVAGDVEVPVDPQRIVTTHNIATQPLIDLGVEPVGMGEMPEVASYPEYWEQIKDIEPVTSGGEPNIEQIVDLDPDLIFAINLTPEEVLDKLEAIAPVIQIGIDGEQRSDWQGRAAMVAEAVGAEDALDDLTSDYAERTAEIRTTYVDVLEGNTVNVLDSFAADSITPYSPTSMVGSVITAAGAQFAPSGTSEIVKKVDATSGEGGNLAITYEQLGDLTDGSVVLTGSAPADDQPTEAQQAMVDSKLFQAAPAAEAGDVYPIGKTTIAGYGDAFGTLRLLESALKQLQNG